MRRAPGHPCTLALVLALALAGCGSMSRAELPPPAGPAPSPPLQRRPAGEVFAGALGSASPDRLRATAERGGATAVLDPRGRTLRVRDAQGAVTGVPAGAGPTAVVSEADRFYVVDAVGEGLLVVQTQPEPRVSRRVALPGGPYAAAVEPGADDLYVTLTARNEVVRLPAHSRPFVDARFPAVRAPRAIAVTSGAVLVRGAAATQILAPRDADGERDR